MGYRTCYYRTFAVGSASRAQRDAYMICRELMDRAIDIVKPGATTADVVALWPTAQEFGFANEEAAFALQYGHGVGLSIWERPIFSRLTSFDSPETLEEGMVFALETYWPAADGWGAARIEEEVVVTATGCEVITKFPAEELLVAGKRYFTTGGHLPTMRDSQSHLNTVRHRPTDDAEREVDPPRRRCSHEAPPVGPPLRRARRRAPPGPQRPQRRRRRRPRRRATSSTARMREMRSFEKRAYDLFMKQLVKGTSHLSLGMEAIAAGFGAAMREDDYTFATYRGHAHTLARGVPMTPVLAELLGRANGLMGGKGGSMHLTSVEHGMMGSYAIIGAHLTIANGAAWSAQYRGSGQVTVCFFGDGTTNIGAFHEALNYAAVYRLPDRLRLREQPLHGVHLHQRHHRGPPPGGRPGRGLRPRRRRHRRERRRRGPPRRP